MTIIQPGSRRQLSGEDIDFITTTLDVSGQRWLGFASLLADQEALDVILDAPELATAVHLPECREVMSKQLYHYLIIRQAMLHFDVDDRDTSDYLAAMLTTYAESAEIDPQLGPNLDTSGLVELMRSLKHNTTENKFFIRQHLGNTALYLTSLFPERIALRTDDDSLPDYMYFERLGQASYRVASGQTIADEFGVRSVLQTLAANFRRVRLALYSLAERQMITASPYIDHAALMTPTT